MADIMVGQDTPTTHPCGHCGKPIGRFVRAFPLHCGSCGEIIHFRCSDTQDSAGHRQLFCPNEGVEDRDQPQEEAASVEAVRQGAAFYTNRPPLHNEDLLCHHRTPPEDHEIPNPHRILDDGTIVGQCSRCGGEVAIRPGGTEPG